MAASEMTLERAEQLAERLLPDRTQKRRMLVVVNPYATTVSARLKNLVVYALESRYDVRAVDTESPADATRIVREAAGEGYEVVVSFGGDGTVNEVANGLAHSDTPLSCLPGGATNVYCRTLGIPADVVDATEHLLRMADDFRPRRVDLGRVDERYFAFSAGIGLDANVVKRVDAHPRVKTTLGEWYYAYAAISTFNRRYLVRPPHVSVEVAGQRVDGVTVVVQNSDPYTYFGDRPIRICEGAGLDTGTLGLAVLRRATPLELPTVLWRVLSGRAETVVRHGQIDAFRDVREARVSAAGERPFPLHVDGDFVGELDSVRLGVERGALAVVS